MPAAVETEPKRSHHGEERISDVRLTDGVHQQPWNRPIYLTVVFDCSSRIALRRIVAATEVNDNKSWYRLRACFLKTAAITSGESNVRKVWKDDPEGSQYVRLVFHGTLTGYTCQMITRHMRYSTVTWCVGEVQEFCQILSRYCIYIYIYIYIYVCIYISAWTSRLILKFNTLHSTTNYLFMSLI